MFNIVSLISILILTVAACGTAQATTTISAAEQQKIQAILEKVSEESGKKLPVDKIQTTAIPGLLQVTSDLNIFYITSDGRYVVLGEILDTSKQKKAWSLTEQAARQLRLQYLATISDKDQIIFPATVKKIATVYVFADEDCHYCRKMQQNIKEYSDAGIEIRSLAFPRSGPEAASFNKAIFELGRKMGVNGTPTLILDNGLRVGGYVDAPTLLQILNETK